MRTYVRCATRCRFSYKQTNAHAGTQTHAHSAQQFQLSNILEQARIYEHMRHKYTDTIFVHAFKHNDILQLMELQWIDMAGDHALTAME